jgi:hypothetical protein
MAKHEESICKSGVDLGRKLPLNRGPEYDCDFIETNTNIRICITMMAREMEKCILEVN